MSVSVANDLMQIVNHLRLGGAYREDNLTWEHYECLLHELSDNHSVRVFYDQGKLEIVARCTKHEQFAKNFRFYRTITHSFSHS